MTAEPLDERAQIGEVAKLLAESAERLAAIANRLQGIADPGE